MPGNNELKGMSELNSRSGEVTDFGDRCFSGDRDFRDGEADRNFSLVGALRGEPNDPFSGDRMLEYLKTGSTGWSWNTSSSMNGASIDAGGGGFEKVNCLVSPTDNLLVFLGFCGESKLCSDNEDLSGDLLSSPSLLGFLTTAVFASLVVDIRCRRGVFSFTDCVGWTAMDGDVAGEAFGILEGLTGD